jgi:hypothetical protein
LDASEGQQADHALYTQIQQPNGYYQIKDQGQGSGDYSFTAPQDGRYEYCFSNEAWASYTKEVAFNVHGIVYVPASEATTDPLENAGQFHLDTRILTHSAVSLTRHLHTIVKTSSDLLSLIRDEQSYIVVRERTHRNTAESTNSRVKWWSIFQLIVLLGEGVFQVWWLKRFFEVKDPSRPSFNRGALG